MRRSRRGLQAGRAQGRVAVVKTPHHAGGAKLGTPQPSLRVDCGTIRKAFRLSVHDVKLFWFLLDCCCVPPGPDTLSIRVVAVGEGQDPAGWRIAKVEGVSGRGEAYRIGNADRGRKEADLRWEGNAEAVKNTDAWRGEEERR